MKVLEKTALVVAIVLALFCLVSIAVLFFTDFGVDFLKSNGELEAAGRELTALDRQFPFDPPPGAGIPKERMEPFLAVSCRAKPSADSAQAWIEEHGQVWVGEKPVYSVEGARLMAAYVKDLTAALSEAKMGPEEFNWIHQRLRLVSKGPPSEKERQEARDDLEEIRKLSEDPQTGARERAELQRHMTLLESLPSNWGPASQAEWEIYQANTERIKSCGHGNKAVHALHQFLAASPGKTRTGIVIDPDEEEAPPPPPAPPAPPAAPATR